MARKRDKTDDETGLNLDEIYSAEPLGAALEHLYSELDIDPAAGQVQVQISKIGATDGKEARIWQGTPADYDLAALAKRFGSAEYRVKIYAPNPLTKGGMSLRGSKMFKMELDPQDDARLELMRKGITQPTQSQPAVTAEAIAQAVAQAIKSALPAPAAPVFNPMDLLKGLADVMKAIAPAQPQGLNALDALKTAAGIFKELRGSDDEREPIDRGVNATGMDVFMKLIDKFGPALLAAAGQGQPQPGQPALPAPDADAKPAVPTVEDEAMIKFKMALAFLVSQAQADNDPTTYAGMILDNIAESDLDALLKNEQWLEYLAGFEPRVMNQRKWFTELRDAVIELRKSEGDEAAADALTGKPEGGKNMD